MNLLDAILLGPKRARLLEDRGWYRNMVMNYADPHCRDWMSPLEIRLLSLPQLEYKLRHGSMAALPEDLR